jgi:hypothetical protein
LVFLWRGAFAAGLSCGLVVEKMLEVRATFDYRSRSLLEIGLYSFEEGSRDLYLEALFYDKFMRSVSKLGVLFQNRIDLLPEARVPASQLVLYHRRQSFGFGWSERCARNLVRTRGRVRGWLQLGTRILRDVGEIGR